MYTCTGLFYVQFIYVKKFYAFYALLFVTYIFVYL